MSDLIEALLEQLKIRIRLQEEDYLRLFKRYDDAMKRINDMQAELEYLRQEINRQ